jgi:hypothetical protein
MWRSAVVVATVVVLGTASARAEERAGSAALGALSGAIVLGPVGAVAGAVVGYTAGPAISRSWGLSGPPRRKRQAAPRAPRNAASVQSSAVAEARAQVPRAAPVPRPAPKRAVDKATPAMQGFE